MGASPALGTRGAAWLACALGLLAPAGAARAQGASEAWRPAALGYPSWSTLEGIDLTGSVGYHRSRASGRLAMAAQVDLSARITGAGTRVVAIGASVPGLWPRWRVLAALSSERLERFPYYGIGNGTLRDDALLDSIGEDYYRYRLLRSTAYLAVQREVGRSVRVHLAGQARHYRVRAAVGPSRLAADLTAGLSPDTGGAGGVEVRAGVVLDTRDFEPVPRRGVWLEAVVGHSVSAPFGRAYTRGLLGAREFLPVGRAVVALRQSLEAATDGIPLPVMAERLTTWGPEDHVGGYGTLRASRTGRWLAPERVVLAGEYRHPVETRIPGRVKPITLWIVPFLDVARLWGAGDGFAVRQLHGGAGLAGVAQFSRGGMVALSVGHSTDSPAQVLLGSGFAF